MAGIKSSIPNTPAIQLLDQYKKTTSAGQGDSKLFNGLLGRSFNHAEYGVALDFTERQEMIRSFMGIYNQREDMLRSLNTLRNMDLVQTIVDVFINDGFNASSDNFIFNIRYQAKNTDGTDRKEDDIGKNINAQIESFKEKVKLAPFIQNCLEDLLLIGEYPFRPIREEKQGIVELADDLEPANIVAVCRNEKVEYYLEKRDTKIFIREPYQIKMFSMATRKVRVRAGHFQKHQFQTRMIPEYYRVGRSILYPAVAKLKRLQIIEMASIANALNRVLTPKILGLSVPANAQPEDITEITKRYERRLQELRTNIAVDGQLEFQELLNAVGRIFMVPQFADGKGAMTPIDINEPDDNGEQENRLRVAAAVAIGVPPYYLSILGEAAMGKVEMLKSYSRYSRKLVGVQNTLADTVVDLTSDHLKDLGIHVKPEEIVVEFKSIVNTDALDTMEYSVAATQVLQDISSALEAVASSQNMKVKINTKKFIALFESLMEVIPGTKGILVEVTDEELPQGPPEASPDGSLPSPPPPPGSPGEAPPTEAPPPPEEGPVTPPGKGTVVPGNPPAQPTVPPPDEAEPGPLPPPV